MRLIFSPIAAQAPRLFDLPWAKPLEEWSDWAVGPLRRSDPHRHVIRLVEDGGEVWVIKELPQPLAWHEYRLLGQLADLGIPSVSLQGIVVDRAPGVDAALVTRYLKYSSTYQDFYRDRACRHPHDRLLDALIELLVRLHLAGFCWGDASLSNTLFRRDAGTLAAYLVDAETAELHPSLSDGQRRTDVSQTCEQVAGELLDLQTGGLLGADLDPVEVAFDIERRYQRLWEELTGERIVRAGEQGQRVSERLRRLNQLGFDAKQVELANAGPDRTRLRVTAQADQPGRDHRHLYQRTGLVAQPHQARLLLNELSSFASASKAAPGDRYPKPLPPTDGCTRSTIPSPPASQPTFVTSSTRSRSWLMCSNTAGFLPKQPATKQVSRPWLPPTLLTCCRCRLAGSLSVGAARPTRSVAG